jgi:hypothetical protein
MHETLSLNTAAGWLSLKKLFKLCAVKLKRNEEENVSLTMIKLELK